MTVEAQAKYVGNTEGALSKNLFFKVLDSKVCLLLRILFPLVDTDYDPTPGLDCLCRTRKMKNRFCHFRTGRYQCKSERYVIEYIFSIPSTFTYGHVDIYLGTFAVSEVISGWSCSHIHYLFLGID
ncbi:hypothetical protein I3843_06G026900 [Carya illinoinensis]|uniref:Uncharacterized protein n=1 Tax=Carya illinoinensis TaxID=32201 RepID=A0A922ENV4_CARIL|nr:hypothetical protein I3842_06G028000 [Carya illinoinensis]KAG7974038.1 hypothetical protein I3843_06G026900 [Carya illinoinensis]